MNKLGLFIFCLNIFMLIACDDNLSKANFPIINVSTQHIIFPSPEIGSNESRFELIVTNEGTADLIIVNTKLIEENILMQKSEISLLDKDDWNNRLVLSPKANKKLILSWKPLDANQDSAKLEITSNDGVVQIEIDTVDLDPDISLISQPPIVEEDQIDLLVFSEAMYNGYQKSILEIRPASIVPLTLEEICLLDDEGNCRVFSVGDTFFLCDDDEATINDCTSSFTQLPILEFDETYKFSLFFHVTDDRDSSFYGKLRIKSNASQEPNYLIQLRGLACKRDMLNPICQNCGDGRLDEYEECDDANLIERDGCGIDCKITERSSSYDMSIDNDSYLYDFDIDINVMFDQGIMDQGIMDQGIMDQGIMDQGIMDQGIMDQGIMDQSIVDSMIDEILNVKLICHSNLLLGAINHRDDQYELIGVISTGSSMGESINYNITSTLNP